MRNVTVRDDRGMPVPPQRTVSGVLEEVLREDYRGSACRTSSASSSRCGSIRRTSPTSTIPEEVKAEVMTRLDRMYKDKEVMFPVTVGLTRFLQEGAGGGDRLGLARWASGRFAASARPRRGGEQRQERTGGPAGRRLPRVLRQRRGRGEGRRHAGPRLRRPGRRPDAPRRRPGPHPQGRAPGRTRPADRMGEPRVRSRPRSRRDRHAAQGPRPAGAFEALRGALPPRTGPRRAVC